MGRKKKANGAEPANEAPPPEHNMKARADIMRECASELDRIDEERKALNEIAGDVRQRLKDAGISVKEFELVRRLHNMDSNERDEYLDNLREAMGALKVGQQGSLFPIDVKVETDGEQEIPEHLRRTEESKPDDTAAA